MKALILGAGYGTRLMKGLEELPSDVRERYTLLIKDKPKILIPILGKPLVEYLLEKIAQETSVHEVYIVTNNRFYSQCLSWKRDFSTSLSVHIINDGTETNETRLGVLGDLEFALGQAQIDDDLMLLAGDTLFEMDFGELEKYFQKRGTDVISVYTEDWSVLSRRGVVVTDEQGQVTEFLEKPQHPPTNLAAPIAYILTKETLRRLPEFHYDYNREDNLIERLVRSGRHTISTFSFPKRYDIGNIQDYVAVEAEFSRREQS